MSDRCLGFNITYGRNFDDIVLLHKIIFVIFVLKNDVSLHKTKIIFHKNKKMTNHLLNEFNDKHQYSLNKKMFQEHLMEQYKLYVEMADRISARRHSVNVYFLTLNTTMLGALGFLFDKIKLVSPSYLVIIPLLGVLVLTIAWWWLLRSYKNLNTAKFKVIGSLEKQLPHNPYAHEWKELGEGSDIKRYLPLTDLEKIVPIVFGLLYIMLGVFVMI